MLTKGAIGNLVNRYRAVLKKCNLINMFGSLAVASMLVMGGAGVASADPGYYAQQGNSTITIDIDGTTDGFQIATFKGNSEYAGRGTFYEAGDNSVIKNLDQIILLGPWFQKRETEDGKEDAENIFRAGADNTLQFINIREIVTQGNDHYTAVAFHANNGDIYIGSEENPITNITLKHVGNGFMTQSNGSITVYANDIVVESGSNAAQCSYNGEASSLIINANNISLSSSASAGVSSMGGTVEFNASGKLSIEGSNAVNANHGGSLTLSADEIYIEENNDNARNALRAANGGNVTVAPTSKAEITGNVYAEGTGSEMEVDLGIGGSLTGKITTDAGSSTGLEMGTDSIWKVTGASNVTTIDADGGVVDMSGTSDNVAVKNLEGNGLDVVMDAAKTNTFSVEEETSTKVTTKAASGNADTLTSDDAAAMAQRVTAADGTTPLEGVTAEVAEGIVNAGFTTDSEGKIVSGGGASSVTKAVLEAASVNTVALDKILTNDVRKRLGDIRSDANKTGVWMRWDGGKLKGNGLTNEFNTIQIGGDTKVARNCRLGVAGSFTHGEGDFARGSSELEGFSFAAYATWMGDNGMFADVVARIGHFSTEVNVEGQSGDMDNRMASISGEYGWRFNLCQQFFIEPQVELAYTYVNSDDLELETAKFSFDSVDSLTGRVGLVAGWNLPDDRGNVYARASVVQQFMGDAKVTGFSSVAPTVHETDGDDTWLEYGIGANVKLTDNTYIWADVERTEGADIDEEWRGTVGVRFSF